ncbi:MAG TPA: diguanylate cyclase [Sedimenticola sp.]|nr:diguanylate cyclase [Sedimenticola sp.]
MNAPDIKQRTVLIVDDSPNNVRILGESLRQQHQVLYATNGKDALERAFTQAPDLILLDIMMPEMDGYEICARLKADPRTREIPIIFITAMDGEEHETIGLEMGAIDFIAKPINPRLVRLRVQNQIELKVLRDYYKTMSKIDGLTGIANRRRLEEFLEHEWKRSVRSGSRLALIMMDIDYFKAFNDHYGHSAGDDCLRRIATALAAEMTRSTDLVARYGGEEFACVLAGTGGEGARLMGEKLHKRVTSLNIPHAGSAVAGHVTLSLGAAWVMPSQDASPAALVDAADKNLYLAKSRGRNRLVC